MLFLWFVEKEVSLLHKYRCMEKITFELRTDNSFIQLIQLLKATNIVYSGSEAQQLVAEGLVFRNGLPELRKRAKLVVGDVISYQEFEITIV